MKIKFVEIANFRKLKSVRIGFSDQTTVLVGANNSGKTSAISAIGHFLVDPNRFNGNDVTLSNWKQINPIGKRWEALSAGGGAAASSDEFIGLMPSLDLWLDVPDDQIYLVAKMVPTLEWKGGVLGLRLQMEPDDIEKFAKEYLAAIKAAKETTEAAKKAMAMGESISVALWPSTMREFLERKLLDVMTIRCYPLDPEKLKDPKDGVAVIQPLRPESSALPASAVRKLICVDEVHAERNMGGGGLNRSRFGENDTPIDNKRKLSEQLRAYYKKHLDPSDFPEPKDVTALDAIEKAQLAFDDRLAAGFKDALDEIEGMGYPGVSDPKIKISTRLRPLDGLNHETAVRYEIQSNIDAAISGYLRLPEDYNGLGYQNLIYIVFKLMSFRDEWMQVGKVGRKAALEGKEKTAPCPLHLVLVEEPEAHLHAQVQQVFVRRAHKILRKHEALGDKKTYHTQLLISTHSSHIAHECEFSWLRYFRRLPPNAVTEIPSCAVVNLSTIFGEESETDAFVRRYLKATHCDLFFADAAILVERPAERMLVPHFIRGHYEQLNSRYVTLLEIGGSHAHRLKPLIDGLGLTTLIITDLDSASPEGTAAVAEKGKGQKTLNSTLKFWLPKNDDLDALLSLEDSNKQAEHPHGNAVRVAYQTPAKIKLPKNGEEVEYIPYTFEDALVVVNPKIFAGDAEVALAARLKECLEEADTALQLGTKCKAALAKGGKAQFACDLLSLQKEPSDLAVPDYIAKGLQWLSSQLKARDVALGLEKPFETLAGKAA